MTMAVRATEHRDAEFVRRVLLERWHGTGVTGGGQLYDVVSLPGFVATVDGVPTGLLAYDVDERGLCVVVIDAGTPGRGVGQALMAAAFDEARNQHCQRVWLTTSNDNVAALRFYLRLGMRLVTVHLGAVDDARERLKPTIPTHSADGVAIHDEWELELLIR